MLPSDLVVLCIEINLKSRRNVYVFRLVVFPALNSLFVGKNESKRVLIPQILRNYQVLYFQSTSHCAQTRNGIELNEKRVLFSVGLKFCRTDTERSGKSVTVLFVVKRDRTVEIAVSGPGFYDAACSIRIYTKQVL